MISAHTVIENSVAAYLSNMSTTPTFIDPHVLLKREPSADCGEQAMVGVEELKTEPERLRFAASKEQHDEDDNDDDDTLTASIKADIAHRSPLYGNLGSDDEDDDSKLLHSAEGKKLSPKERRQLRNKVSARNFRVRRKEYIGHLESLVNAHSSEAKSLRKEVASLRKENQDLATELSRLKLSGADAHAQAVTANTPASITSPFEEPLEDTNAALLNSIDTAPMLPSLVRSNSQRSAMSLQLQRDSSSLIPTRESFQKDINPWSAGSQFAGDWPLSGLASPTGPSSPFDFNLNQFTSVFALRDADAFSPHFSEKELLGKGGQMLRGATEMQACITAFDDFLGCVLGSGWHATA